MDHQKATFLLIFGLEAVENRDVTFKTKLKDLSFKYSDLYLPSLPFSCVPPLVLASKYYTSHITLEKQVLIKSRED